MTVETRDILLKAAEDVTQGMWCKGSWFLDSDGDLGSDLSLFLGGLTIDRALKAQRCAQGSIAIATKLLGGTEDDLRRAERAASSECFRNFGTGLVEYNDFRLPDDPFEAGQQLAELFRQTAESL